MAIEFYTELQKYITATNICLCTVIETIGSSPYAGQKMIIRNGSTVGTVGGGINENRAKEQLLTYL